MIPMPAISRVAPRSQRASNPSAEELRVSSIGSTRFVIAPDICSSSDSDGTTILDIQHDKIYSLIGLSSLIWGKLVAARDGLTLTALVDDLSEEFRDVPRQQIQSDVEHQLTDFWQKKFIEDNRDPEKFENDARQSNRGTWLVVQQVAGCLLNRKWFGGAAFIGLAVSSVVLRVFGFGALHRMVKDWPVIEKQGNVDSLKSICMGVDSATSWFPKHALCLSRSAVTSCLLRAQGIHAEMVIGCNKIPFKAHAWVEVDGEVVNDRKRVQQSYKVLARW